MKLVKQLLALSALIVAHSAAEMHFCSKNTGKYKGPDIDAGVWKNPVYTCQKVCKDNNMNYLGWTDGDPIGTSDPCNNSTACVCSSSELWNALRTNNINQLMFDSMALLYGNPPPQGATTNTSWQQNPAKFYAWLANQKDTNGNTAMANAAARGYTEIVAALVNNGATVPDSNACGWVGKQAQGAHANQQNIATIRDCVCKGNCSALTQVYGQVFNNFTQNFLPQQPNGQTFLNFLQNAQQNQ